MSRKHRVFARARGFRLRHYAPMAALIVFFVLTPAILILFWTYFKVLPAATTQTANVDIGLTNTVTVFGVKVEPLYYFSYKSPSDPDYLGQQTMFSENCSLSMGKEVDSVSPRFNPPIVMFHIEPSPNKPSTECLADGKTLNLELNNGTVGITANDQGPNMMSMVTGSDPSAQPYNLWWMTLTISFHPGRWEKFEALFPSVLFVILGAGVSLLVTRLFSKPTMTTS